MDGCLNSGCCLFVFHHCFQEAVTCDPRSLHKYSKCSVCGRVLCSQAFLLRRLLPFRHFGCVECGAAEKRFQIVSTMVDDIKGSHHEYELYDLLERSGCRAQAARWRVSCGNSITMIHLPLKAMCAGLRAIQWYEARNGISPRLCGPQESMRVIIRASVDTNGWCNESTRTWPVPGEADVSPCQAFGDNQSVKPHHRRERRGLDFHVASWMVGG